jgi:hypothetical protein
MQHDDLELRIWKIVGGNDNVIVYVLLQNLAGVTENYHNESQSRQLTTRSEIKPALTLQIRLS